MFNLIFTQTVKLSFRKGGGALGSLAFYVLVFTLFAFALGVEELQAAAPAVLCVALVLSGSLGLPLMFERDEEEGMLEQYLTKAPMLELVVLAKMLGFWVVQALPILLLLPVLAIMSGMEPDVLEVMWGRLFLLSLSLTAINTLVAALTLGNRRGGILPALIGFPLVVPLVIFASSVGGGGAVLLLAAAALVSVPVACFVSAMVLRLV